MGNRPFFKTCDRRQAHKFGLTILSSLVAFLVCSPSLAQEIIEIERPRGSVLQIQGIPGGGGFTSYQVSEVDGIKTTNVVEDGKRFKIVESPDEISVTYVKTYGPNDFDKLKEDHPDLFMHVSAFPARSGDAKISLTISAETTRTAKSADELEQRFPEAYAVFKRLKEANHVRGMAFPADIRRFDFRAIELPEGFEIPVMEVPPSTPKPPKEGMPKPAPKRKIDT